MTVNVTTSGTTVVLTDDEKVTINIPGGGATTVEAQSGGNVDKIVVHFRNNDSAADTVTVDLSTFSENNLKVVLRGYDASDEIILDGATNLTVDPSNSARMTFEYVGSDGGTYTGVAVLRDSGENDFNASPAPIAICFTEGTHILADRGEVLVENLAVGDLVLTLQSGYQPIRWIGCKVLDSVDLAVCPHLRPVAIEAHALGRGIPEQMLTVSPQHRICIGNSNSQLLFGHDVVLVAAKHLINGSSIMVDVTAGAVTYFHLLFDEHQVIYSNGTPSESLHTGDIAISALDVAAKSEVLSLFPELEGISTNPSRTALPVLKSFEAALMQTYEW